MREWISFKIWGNIVNSKTNIFSRKILSKSKKKFFRAALLLDYGEISEEFKVVAESVAEWGEKIYEEEVFPLFVTLSTFSVPDLLPWLHQYRLISFIS